MELQCYQEALTSCKPLPADQFKDLLITKTDPTTAAGCIKMEAGMDTFPVNVTGLDYGLSSDQCLQGL